MMSIAIVEDSEDESDQYRELIEAAWDDVEVDQLFNEDQARAMFDTHTAVAFAERPQF